MYSIRVGFSPSISSKRLSANGFATRGSTALTSPQPTTPWLVSILRYTAGPTQVARVFVILMEDDLSATLAAGLRSWPAASDNRACPTAAAPAAASAWRRERDMAGVSGEGFGRCSR